MLGLPNQLGAVHSLPIRYTYALTVHASPRPIHTHPPRPPPHDLASVLVSAAPCAARLPSAAPVRPTVRVSAAAGVPIRIAPPTHALLTVSSIAPPPTDLDTATHAAGPAPDRLPTTFAPDASRATSGPASLPPQGPADDLDTAPHFPPHRVTTTWPWRPSPRQPPLHPHRFSLLRCPLRHHLRSSRLPPHAPRHPSESPAPAACVRTAAYAPSTGRSIP